MIVELFVEDGEKVEKGDKLFKIEVGGTVLTMMFFSVYVLFMNTRIKTNSKLPVGEALFNIPRKHRERLASNWNFNGNVSLYFCYLY